MRKNRVPKVGKLTLSRNISKQKQSRTQKGEPKKMEKENELKRNLEEKQVEMKMKRNKEGRPK